MIQIRTTKNKRIIRASDRHYLHQLGLSSEEALSRINDLPDGFLDNLKDKELIDKDLLKEIRDSLDFVGRDEGYSYCAELCDKLDNLYPFLK